MNETTMSLEQDRDNGRAGDALGLPTVLAALFYGTIAVFVFLVLPLYVGALAENGYDDGQLGNLASMDLAGMAVASVLALFWMKRLNWRWVGAAGMAVVIAANLACLGVDDYGTLLILRLVAGLGGGSAVVLAYGVVASTTHPDRYMGLFVVTQMVFQVAAFLLLPSLLERFGLPVFYYLFIGLASVGLLLAFLLPSTGHAEELHRGEADGLPVKGRLAIFLVLVAIMLFFLGQSGIWAFGELIGTAAGLDDQTVGNLLAGTTALALFGGLASAWLDVRFGRVLPILVAVLVQVAMLLFFYGEMSATFFFGVFGAFSFCWNFGIAYQVGTLVSVDTEGRYTALIPAFQGAGLALGPAVAGLFLSGEGYYSVNVISGIALLAYLALILPFARRR